MRVTRKPKAVADIQEIWAYIAEDSIVEADRWVDKLDEKLSLWASRPMIGRGRDEIFKGIRSLPFGRYVVFYHPLQDGIDVVRVIHSARDVDAVFDEDQH